MTQKLLLPLLVLATACTRPILKDTAYLPKDPMKPLAPYFQGDSMHLFKTTFDVYGKQLSGILVARHMPDNSYRMVMSPSSGPTFFDGEFRDGKFKMVNCMKQLNKKIVINLLEKDLRLLFFAPEDDEKACLRYLENEYCRYKINGRVDRATFGPVQQPLIGITYTYDSTMFPARTLVHHTNFQLDITLQPVKQD
ncbi:MAG: hypothetical protein K2Q22_05640 [Cytophagales bacterium]|nr:hypothetical protein [Cytophagales bacterium]